MALFKTWSPGGRYLNENVASLPAYDGPLAFTGPDTGPSWTLLRTVTFARVTSHVATSDATHRPPPGWWQDANVTLSAYWSPGGTTDPPTDDWGGDLSIGYRELQPTLALADTVGSGYTLSWTTGPEPWVTETSRRSDGPLVPAVVFYLNADTSHGIFKNPGGFWTVTHSVLIESRALWGTPPPIP